MKGLSSRKISLSAFAAAITVGVFGASLVPYVNDFSQRTSAAIPSGRWMETEYKTGSLARRLAASEITAYSPYANESEYQDGWAAKKIWGSASGKTGFSVVSDNGNQVVMANGTSGSYDTTDTAVIQPLGNEFKNGILKISVDIRTPSQTDSFVSNDRAYALFAPVFKSELDVTSSGVGMPLYFGPASLNDGGYKLRAVSRGRKSNSSGDEFFGQNDAQNNITAGSWVRYEAILDLSAGTYTAVFNDLNSGAVIDFRQWAGATAPKTLHFATAMTEETGGIAGLAFLVRGLKEADASFAPMFDNVSVSWQAPGSSNFVSVYENDFSVRRYRSLEPSGIVAGMYALSNTTNVINSATYDHGSSTYNYNVNEVSAGLLVPESGTAGSKCEGWDGWRRRAGSAGFSLLDPNKDGGGYGWNNGAILRVTKQNEHGVLAVPLGQTIRSGKVRLYFDLMPGRKSVMGDYTEAYAMCYLSGGGMGESTFVNTTTRSTMWGAKAVCGAGYYVYDDKNFEVNPGNIVYGAGELKGTPSPKAAASMCTWHRYVITADLDSKKYEFKAYQYGIVGQPMDYDISSLTPISEASSLNFMTDAPAEIDSLFIASQGHGNYNSSQTWNGNNNLGYGKFPCFDNIRVCRVNDDGSDGLEIYRCDFEGSVRRTVCDAARISGDSGRAGADGWMTRGQTHSSMKVCEFSAGDQVAVIDGLYNLERFAVQETGEKSTKGSICNVVADIRPADAWASANSYALIEIGGDDYFQGNSGWRSASRICFGFSGDAEKTVGLYKAVKFAVGTELGRTLSDVAVNPSHWYRFCVKADIPAKKFSVYVYDQGETKPVVASQNGSLVAMFTGLSMSLDSASALGIAAKGVVSRFGGGTDDPSVIMVDNLAVNIVPPGLQIIVR